MLGLRERLLWPAVGRSAVPISRDRATIARTYAYLFGGGATIVLLTLALPGSPDREPLWGVVAPALVGYAAGAAFLGGFDRLPLRVFQAAPLLGAILVTLVVSLSGASAAGAYAMLYFWVALAACYFFGWRIALAHVAICSALYGLVIVDRHVPLGGLYWVMGVGTLLVLGLLMVGLRAQVERVVSWLSNVAGTDTLTGLPNRREFEDRFAYELERSSRSERPLGLIAIDLDWFKEINDQFGHEEGDRVLKTVAATLRKATRRIDSVARVGGEEFSVLVPEAGEEETHRLAERLRREVKEMFVDHDRPLTLSCGIATFPASGLTSGDLMRAADRALYMAKDLGRDRTIVYRAARDEIAESFERRARAGRASPRLASLASMAESVDRRRGTPGRARDVERYAEALARRLGLPETRVEQIGIAALLHDIGTVGLDESVLTKTGSLTKQEWEEMRRHPEVGERILATADLHAIGEWVLAHHERPDGRGYPRGLRGSDIPLESQIVAVADAYAAMTSDHGPGDAMEPDAAVAELRANAGTQFYPEVVAAFVELHALAGDEPGFVMRDARPAEGSAQRDSASSTK
jgi:diguanylate cyclase (GGDEF)-like protein